MKVKMTISYDGSKFYGYQIQNSGKETVANTLVALFKVFGIDSKINASGRTDRGVHATRQVIDVTLPVHWSSDLDRLKYYLNRHCLPAIQVHDIKEVDADFHARFSAKRRVYRYLIKEGEASVFASSYLHYHDKVDVKKLQEVVKVFEGVHDFVLFSKSGSAPKSTVREIYKCRFYRYKDLCVFSVEANSFLRSQIRMMVDFLLKINDDVLTVYDLKLQLSAKRSISRDLAKPSGLYLCQIKY